ncbi:VCBS repeat-containing protein [Couchioplanes caeruleus]|uniref:FG-GAP and VCBS repeat-containing protein n=1 Tax=Couchioplanes caeruleus TaxID=56438 RepID=UPI0020C15397|nr:FG-GAP and VCBS repeat-containing protein [Couchioplanes caeruleus]UQU65213.1 VCBS repeat-containing protein [Couchioplanes caeruleus]
MKLVRIVAAFVAASAASATFLAVTPADAGQRPVPPAGDPSARPWSPKAKAQAARARAAQTGAAKAGSAQAGAAQAAGADAHAMSSELPGAAEIVRDGITLLHLRTSVTRTPVSGSGATRSDFDGDGRDDIAAFSTGGVIVTYSSAPVRDRLVTEIPGGSGCGCFGVEMVTGNFNGDKYDDLAIADSSEADLRAMGYFAGAVWVFPGGPSGLKVDAVKHFNQSTSGVPGASATSDWFADSLAAGDVTGDGRDELLVGIPGKKVGGKKEAGAAVVLKGSASGVVATGAKWIDQNSSGVPGGAETGDHFGGGVAIGKINKDKYRDVVIGAPQEDDGQAWMGSGSVTQFWGGSAGVSSKKVTVVSGSSTGAVAEAKDAVVWYLGGVLAIGDTNGDGYGEVVAGDSAAQANWEINGGVVVTLKVGGSGITTKGMVLLSQHDRSIAGSAEDNDYFGDSIAVGDVTQDGIADVLVGVPGEDIGGTADAGEVVLLRGSRTGLTGSGSWTLTQSSGGVPDGPETGDAFGAAVSLLNLNGKNGLDAAVGAPGESVAGDAAGWASGTVTKVYGGSNGLGGGSAVSGRSLGVVEASYGYVAHQ